MDVVDGWHVPNADFSLVRNSHGLHESQEILEGFGRGENLVSFARNVLAPKLLLGPQVERG